jgi:hypothetical protein
MNEKYLLIVLSALIAVTVGYQWYWRRRYPNASDLDKALNHVKVEALFVAAVLMFLAFILPLPNYWEEIRPDDVSTVAISKLVENQKIFQSNDYSTRNWIALVGFLLSFFLFDIHNLIRKIQDQRQRELEAGNPEAKSSVGL